MSEKRDSQDVEEAILDFLDQLGKPEQRAERVERIDGLIARLNFERRLTLLTDEERQHMMDEGLSPAERATLDALQKDSSAWERKITEFARARYFRKCAWADYLNGATDNKPWTSKKKAK